MSGQIRASEPADLLGGLCGGGEGDFPFSEQLDYTVRGSGRDELLKLQLHGPASAVALSLSFLSRDLNKACLACF